MTQHFRLARTTWAAVMAAVWLVQVPSAIHAQDPQPSEATFRTSVAVVPISAVVRDSRNRVVRDLAREDFHILENSQTRQIVDFRSTDNAALSLAVLFDTSGSMRGSNFDRGRAAVGELLEGLNPAADEVALFTFDKGLRQETPFTGDVDRVWLALNNTDAWGLTSLYDAVADAAKALADRRQPRRAVIVVTDGLDTSSSLTSAQVSGIASAIDVPVYVVAVVPPASSGTGEAKDGDLSALAHWTGGDVTRVTGDVDTGSALAPMMSELRQQYFIAIESASASGWYRLDVQTKRRGLTVRARNGYFAGRPEIGS